MIFLNTRIDLFILKTDVEKCTTTNKKTLHLILKAKLLASIFVGQIMGFHQQSNGIPGVVRYFWKDSLSVKTSQSDEDRLGVDGIGLVYDDDDDVAAGEFPDAVVGVVHVSALLMSFRTACTLKTHNLCIHPRDLPQSAKIAIFQAMQNCSDVTGFFTSKNWFIYR